MYPNRNSTDTRCGICSNWIKHGQYGIAIFTGGTYGKLCHILCAIETTQKNLNNLSELFCHSGKRGDRIFTPDKLKKARLIGL